MKQELIKIRALRALPYNKLRLPGEEFDVKAGFAAMFVHRKMAEYVEEAPKPKRKYKKRALKAENYNTTELTAA